MESELDYINKGLKTMMLEPRTDRISQLPDHILHHILSFLPQNLVPKTLFLSKRWLNLSTTLPSLSFDFRPYNRSKHSETITQLISFVEKTLSCREKFTVFEKFSLSSSRPNYCLDMDLVNGWIREVVLRHGVRELDLKIEHNKVHFCWPFPVTCNSLISLKLSFVDRCEKPFPANFSFPNLKTMNLTHVVLHTDFASQLINCPKLENLVIDSCTFGDNKSPVPYEDSSLGTLIPNIFNVCIDMNGLWDIYTLDILRVAYNVEVLSLRIPSPMHLYDLLPKMNYFSKFSNLKVLELGELSEMKIGVSFMDGMLRSLPALELLNIGCITYREAYEDGSGTGIPNWPLRSERLKFVRIGRIFPDWMIIKIKLVKYFLEGAKSLEKMIVSKPKHLNPEELDQALQALPNIGALELSD